MSQICTLLAAIHSSSLLPHEYIERRAIHRGTGEITQAWHRDPGSLAAEAPHLAATRHDVYFGIQPRQGRRGGNDAVARAGCIVADQDSKVFGAMGEARRAAEACPIPATAGVASGSDDSLHLYWALAEPLDVLTDAGQVRYRTLCQRMAQLAAGRDHAPDAIHDRARILRLPDTLNWKHDPPRPVTLAWCDATRRYDVDDLEAWLDAHALWTAPPEPTYAAPRASRCTGDVIGAFKAGYDFPALLLQHGAHLDHVCGGVEYWTRPGKRRDTSATRNHYGDGRLIVFSSEWPPFAPFGPTGRRRAYDAFEAFSLLEHHGDRKAAYHAARALGYGPPKERFGIPLADLSTQRALQILTGGR